MLSVTVECDVCGKAVRNDGASPCRIASAWAEAGELVKGLGTLGWRRGKSGFVDLCPDCAAIPEPAPQAGGAS